MELFKVALEKDGDCHVKRAPAPHNCGILVRPFPSCPTKLQALPEHRITCLTGQTAEKRLFLAWPAAVANVVLCQDESLQIDVLVWISSEENLVVNPVIH
jgi:hypothetical protein